MASQGRFLLVALDPSGCAFEVAEEAAALAADLGIGARLITAVQLPEGVRATTQLGLEPGAAETAEHALVRDARAELEALLGPFEARGVSTQTVVVVGDPAQVVLERARLSRMVVVGTHGRTGLSRLLFGSVAEQIVRRCPVPVVVVPSPGTEAHPSVVQRSVRAEADG